MNTSDMDSQRIGHAAEIVKKLLAPVTPETFVSDYWAKQPLFVPGDPSKLKEILGAPDHFYGDEHLHEMSSNLQTVALLTGPRYREQRALHHTLHNRDTNVDEMDAELADRHTVQFRHPQLYDPYIGRLANHIQAGLGLIAEITPMMWIGKKGSTVDLHFDSFALIQLQLRGRKTWKLETKPTFDWPRTQATAWNHNEVKIDLDGWGDGEMTTVDESNFQTCVMEPGSIMYVPAGTWHRTEMQDEGEPSVSITFTMKPIDFGEVYKELLSLLFPNDPLWRAMVPPALAHTTSLSGEQQQAIADRHNVAMTRLQQLSPQSPEFQRALRRLTTFHRTPVDLTAQTTAPPGEVTPQTQFRLVHEAPVAAAHVTEDGENILYIYVFDEMAQFDDPDSIEFAHQMLEGKPFSGEEAMRWTRGEPHSWEDMRTGLITLYGKGFLEFVGADQ